MKLYSANILKNRIINNTQAIIIKKSVLTKSGAKASVDIIKKVKFKHLDIKINNERNEMREMAIKGRAKGV